METNSLVVTDSNVQALANALCMFAEKMGELSRLYPVYPNSAMESLQRLTDKMQALELQMQKASEFLAPALERFAQEPAEIWKNENVDALLVQVAAAMQSFSDILQTQHEADDLVPVSTATEISKMFSRFLLMTLYLPLNKKSNRPKSQGIRSYGTTCSKSFRLCFAL